MSSRTVLLLIGFSPIAITLAFVFLQLPGNTLFWRALQNSTHSVVFASLAFASLFGLMRLTNKPLTAALIYSSSGLFLLGILIEGAQHLTGRGARLDDLAFNTAGIFSGSCLFLLAHAPTRQQANVAIKMLIVIACGMAVLWSMKYPALYLVTGILRPAIPILVDFENAGEQYFVTGRGSTREIGNHSEWAQNPSQSLKAKYEPGRWPSVQFLEPTENWSKFTQLTFKIYNPNRHSVVVFIRLDDQSLGPMDEDHMTVKRIVPRGDYTATVNFEEFKADAVQRNRPKPATFKSIRSFTVYVRNADESTEIFLDDFLLSR